MASIAATGTAIRAKYHGHAAGAGVQRLANAPLQVHSHRLRAHRHLQPVLQPGPHIQFTRALGAFPDMPQQALPLAVGKLPVEVNVLVT
jgi:hypothetical protein